MGILVGVTLLYISSGGVPAAPESAAPSAVADKATRAPTLAVETPVSTEQTQIARRISLPNAAIYAPIIDVFVRDGTWDVAQLGAQVGHLFGTAPIGVVGNHGLAGHSELRDGSRGIFAWIQQLNYGDPIHIEDADQTYAYRVTAIRRVDPTDLSVLRPTETDRLTLITCADYNFILDLYDTRVVVIAERVA
jgi:LPXTG-site transpeptidase (sortase) family protein